MAIYNIAGITLDFDYLYPAFFEQNIEQYQVSDKVIAKYKMRTEICETIQPPLGKPAITYKNRAIHKDNHDIYIVVRDENGNIKTRIKHTPDYKEIYLKLSAKLGYKLPEQEYLLTGLLFSELATLEDRLAIHGSAFMVHQTGIIIVGSSGVGKSTHAKHWQSNLASFVMINEDRPIIHIENNIFYVSGIPWSGKTKANRNITVPLKTIVFYHQDVSNYVKTMTMDEKLKQLMQHALRPRGEALMDHALGMMDQIIRHCDLIEYHAVDEPSSVLPLFDYIFGGSDEN